MKNQVLKCLACNKQLLDINETNTASDQAQSFIVINCPYCNDGRSKLSEFYNNRCSIGPLSDDIVLEIKNSSLEGNIWQNQVQLLKRQ